MMAEQLQDKIQAYLAGDMSPAEKADFENQIKASEALAEELRRYRQLSVLGKNKSLVAGKILLDAVMDALPITPDYGPYERYFKKPLWPFWRWSFVLFALLLALSGVLFYQTNQEKKASAALAETQLLPMANVIGFAADDQSNAAEAMRAYDGQNYAEAIERLHIEVRDSPGDNSLRLYLAVSYLMQGQTPQAEALLQEMIKTDDLVTVPAKWYLALSLLGRNHKTEARVLFENLKSDAIFGDRVTQLLKDL
jgi:Tetratricopeptide repeat